jgi:hypothetical protein
MDLLQQGGQKGYAIIVGFFFSSLLSLSVLGTFVYSH